MKVNLRGRSQDGSWPVIGSVETSDPPPGVLVLDTRTQGVKYFNLEDAGGIWVYVEARVLERNSESIHWVYQESFWFA
jgi:hypothetical protein